ncbi:hypothetical protein VVD49_01825 [Uliginosibacterium sp. H3]|uniref:Uncharacterized protein n=1 Tax=Uliginosibacterium silvisoli TaxID=3114758 RepID=A0ABU6JZQ1_9RHOO|nr:hypothetical protein [Uliginosibacterium sp. H3]
MTAMASPSTKRLCAPRLKSVVLAMSLGAVAGMASAGPVRSVGSITFADANTAIVADWVGGEIHALQLAPATSVAAQPFRLKNISSPVAQALHVQPDALRFEDMAFRPGTELAYITLSVQRGKASVPALVSVDSSGKVAVINLAKAPQTSVAIKQRPAADQKFWNDIPAASYTVTDMVFNAGKLYVAGLSNASFASTLRVYDFPFNGASTTTSIEMYHAVHNQVETRAPIRKMTIATLDGEPTLIAAYTCTPLVTVALKDLKDGAHIVGKTIAELGWGSAPVDMVTFDAGQGPMVLLTNSHKSADLMTLESIAAASKQPGLSTPIKWPSEPYLGLKAIPVPISGIAKLGNQNKDFLGALRRDEATGHMELVSIRKGAFLRVSDFINEYDFADFTYLPTDYFRGVHQVLRTDEGYPELAARAKP